MSQMKAIMLNAALLAALLAVFAPAPAQAGEIPWLELPEALARQQSQAKPVAIFFHLTYCWRCKEMKRQVFSDQTVIQRLKTQFIPAMVDMAKQEALGKKYGVDYIPTQVFLGPGGKEVFRKKGIVPLGEYLLMLDYVAGGHYAGMDFDTFSKGRR